MPIPSGSTFSESSRITRQKVADRNWPGNSRAQETQVCMERGTSHDAIFGIVKLQSQALRDYSAEANFFAKKVKLPEVVSGEPFFDSPGEMYRSFV